METENAYLTSEYYNTKMSRFKLVVTVFKTTYLVQLTQYKNTSAV